MSGNIRLYNTNGYVELQAPSSASAQVLELPTDSIKPALVHLHTETFSSVSSVSVDDVFSENYNHCLITVTGSGTSDTFMNMRLRSGSTDNTATNYDYQRNSSYDSTYSAASAANQTSWQVHRVRSTGSAALINIYNANLSESTFLISTSGHSGQFTDTRAIHDISTAFDGFTFFPTTGTISGTIRIYGYRNN